MISSFPATTSSAENWMRHLADAMPQMVWMATPDGMLDYYNAQVVSYSGLSLETLIGEGWTNLLHPDDIPGALATWSAALATGAPYEVEFRLKRAHDGVYRWHIARALATCDESGAVVRWFGTCTDIDDQKRTAALLQDANAGLSEQAGELQAQAEELESQREMLEVQQSELQLLYQQLRTHTDSVEVEVARRTAELRDRERELEQVNRYKDEFLGVISHELRTPLNFIMGFASILDDGVAGPLNEQQCTYLGKILTGSDRMLRLVDDLLDIARIQAGQVAIVPAPTVYPEVLEEIVTSLQPLAEQQGVQLSLTAPAMREVLLDGPRIGQVVANLLTNAIKFTPPGGAIRLSAAHEDGWLVTRVEDTGVGIPLAERHRVFEKFQQLDMSPTRAAGGTGLGLSICKALVEAHHGSIHVESEPGRGSVFWFKLPA